MPRKITVQQEPIEHGGKWVVDDPHLPGTPFIGRDSEKVRAIGLWVLAHANDLGLNFVEEQPVYVPQAGVNLRKGHAKPLPGRPGKI